MVEARLSVSRFRQSGEEGKKKRASEGLQKKKKKEYGVAEFVRADCEGKKKKEGTSR